MLLRQRQQRPSLRRSHHSSWTLAPFLLAAKSNTNRPARHCRARPIRRHENHLSPDIVLEDKPEPMVLPDVGWHREQLARDNTPTGVISLKMGRTETTVRGK